MSPRRALLSSPRVNVSALSGSGFRVGDELVFSSTAISGDYSNGMGSAMEIDSSHVDGAIFTGASLRGLRMTDVFVDHADFSGADLEKATLTRVVFRNCRLSGALLPQTRLRDVVFTDSKLDGVNFRMVKGERVVFDRVDLAEGDLYAAELSAARFFDCNLNGAEFSQAVVPGARFHGSTLEGVKGAGYLKDIVIDSTQVLTLALPVFHALSIEINDEREL